MTIAIVGIVRISLGLIALTMFLSACTNGASVRSSLPEPGSHFDYQIGGAYTPDDRVKAVIRDREDEPVEGIWSGCYINAFQSQPGEQTNKDLLLLNPGGNRIEDQNWPGEYLFDVSEENRAEVIALVNSWTDECAAKGFKGVEFDNLDSYTRSDGLLTADDARATARLLINHAHSKGLSVGQKNAVELLEPKLGFDFAVTEECAAYDECDAFADAYTHVFEIEYESNGFYQGCERKRENVSLVYRDVELLTPADADYKAEWCN